MFSVSENRSPRVTVKFVEVAVSGGVPLISQLLVSTLIHGGTSVMVFITALSDVAGCPSTLTPSRNVVYNTGSPTVAFKVMSV